MHFGDVTIGLTAYCRRCSSIDLPTLGDNAMKRMLLWVATVTVFIVGAVLGASLLLWLSVGGTFFRGQIFGPGMAVGMFVLALAAAACVYGGIRMLRASRRA